MHSIKRAARRQAWYNNFEDGEGAHTYNIFGRMTPRPPYGATDLESHMRHAQSAPESSPVDDAILQDQPHPNHHSTFPTGPEWEPSPMDGKAPRIHPSSNSSNRLKTDFEPTESREVNLIQRILLKFVRPKPAGQNQVDEYQDKRRHKYAFHMSTASQLKALFGSRSNILLVFVPIGFALYYTHQSPVATFIVNFLAIIPSGAIVSVAVEEVSLHVGHVLGGLLSMTFTNSAQLISSIFLLRSRQIQVLKASLLGSILQSLLVMTGLSFLLGGFNREEQFFNARIAQTISMLLLLAVLSLTIPTVSQLWGHTSHAGILAQSRGTSVVVIISYALWLVFALKTNRALFREESPKAPKRSPGREAGEAMKGMAMIGAATGAATAGGRINQDNLVCEQAEDEVEPLLRKSTAGCALVLFTTILAFNVEFATNSIQGMIAQHHISNMFVGIVILPLLSNEALPIECAMSDRMDRSIALTMERCMQSALMVVPLVVLIAWGIGIDDMTLDFDGFSVAAVFASIIIVSYVVQEGKSNWLTGALLLKVFVIVGLASFYVDP